MAVARPSLLSLLSLSSLLLLLLLPCIIVIPVDIDIAGDVGSLTVLELLVNMGMVDIDFARGSLKL